MKLGDKIKNLILNYKGLSTLGISNILSSIFLILFWFIIAAIVDTNEYGKISYFIAIATIASTIATPGMGNTLMVYGAKESKIRFPLFLFGIIFATVASIIVFFIIDDFATSLFLVGYTIFNLIIWDLIGKNFFNEILKISVIQKILSIIISISFYYVIGIDGIILGLAISHLVFIPKVIAVLRNGSTNFSILKNYRYFMQDNFGYAFSRILSTQMDKLLIFPLFGFITLGNYYLAIQILAIGTIIPGTVYQYLLPQESKERSFNKLKLLTILFAVAVAIIAFILSPILIPILFPHFTDVVEIVQIMIFSIIPQTVNLMYITKFLTQGKSRVVLIGSVIFIAVQASAIVVLGNMIGIYGLGLALLLGHSTEFIYLAIYGKYFDD